MRSITRSTAAKMFVLMVALLTVFVLAGCKGSDGSDGANGINGVNGVNGINGVNGTNGTNGSNGTNGTNGTTSTNGTHDVTQGKVDQVVSNVSVKNVNGMPVVSFHVDMLTSATTSAPVTNLAASQVRVYMADLVPAGTVSAATNTSYSTSYFDQWASETSSTDGVAFDTSDAANGNYSWSMTSDFGTATPSSGLNDLDYSASHVQRLVLRVSGDGSTTNNTVAIEDYTVPALNSTATSTDTQRRFVTIEACMKCHTKFMDNAAHANGYLDTRACDICHSPLYGSSRHAVGFMDTANAILPVFIHMIHASIDIPNGPSVVYPLTYPQDINNCVTCHVNDTGASLGTGDEINNWKSHPTARVCSSCHTGNTVEPDGKSMIHDQTFTVSGPSAVPPGKVTDSQCGGCHAGDGTSTGNYRYTDIVLVHDASPTGLLATGDDIPEYLVTINTPTPANGKYFVSGETFTVDVTLAANPDFTGTETAIPAVYTDASDTAYVAGNGLHVASLYVYGPRSHEVPLLGKQGQSMFGKGDSTGFHIPVTVPAVVSTVTWSGTYMVRARIADYSYDRNNSTGGGAHAYQAESYALSYIQIGTQTVDKKVDGDNCVNCHADTKMHANDHAAPFNTDHCTSCHDLSGGHGDPIANRVHAVHSANPVGDLNGHDWSEITFPANIERCNTCHSSGNTQYKTNLYEIPCYGCHADETGQPQAHMESMGGITSGFTYTTDLTQESCAVCHGPGASFDISD
jgi:OmcA/MtrC family decaheme c-type cytochrome